jgi:hypothetical protein
LNRNERPAQFFLVAPAKGMDAALAAEQVMARLGVELVVAQRVFTCEQSKCFGLDEDGPVPRLTAIRTVALTRTCAEV